MLGVGSFTTSHPLIRLSCPENLLKALQSISLNELVASLPLKARMHQPLGAGPETDLALPSSSPDRPPRARGPKDTFSLAGGGQAWVMIRSGPAHWAGVRATRSLRPWEMGLRNPERRAPWRGRLEAR